MESRESQREAPQVSFGQAMREEHFSFAEGYLPLNHGSFGTFPKSVLEYQRQLQSESEARPAKNNRSVSHWITRAAPCVASPVKLQVGTPGICMPFR